MNNNVEKRDAESSEAGKHAIRYYESCLQTKKTRNTDTHSRKSLLQLLDLIGGWSIIDKISKKNNLRTSSWNFQETFEIIHNVFRVDVFFRWEVMKQSKNLNWKHMIYVRICLEVMAMNKILYILTVHNIILKVRHDIHEIRSSLSSGRPSDLISEMKEVLKATYIVSLFLSFPQKFFARLLNHQSIVKYYRWRAFYWKIMLGLLFSRTGIIFCLQKQWRTLSTWSLKSTESSQQIMVGMVVLAPLLLNFKCILHS